MSKKRLNTAGIPRTAFGMDPELFMTHPDIGIVGSEEVLAEHDGNYHAYTDYNNEARFVQDGVQLEFHTEHADTCRARLSNAIGQSLRTLRNDARRNGASIDFTTTMKVSKDTLMRLSPESRELGCLPSRNAYGEVSPVPTDGMKYRWRSAGGHIHLDLRTSTTNRGRAEGYRNREDIESLVRLLDLFVGIPSVLLARGKGELKRREAYGRAGEYRVKRYGIEYRTLSNFWLQSPYVFSLIFGQADTAVRVWQSHLNALADPRGMQMWGDPLYDAYPELQTPEIQAEVKEAINTCSYAKARRVFRNVLEPFIREYRIYKGIAQHELPAFWYAVNLCQRNRETPISELVYLESPYPVEEWNRREGHDNGWGNYANMLPHMSEDYREWIVSNRWAWGGNEAFELGID